MTGHTRHSTIVGVVGGMGPAATCALFQCIINKTPARSDQEHLHLLVDSDASTPDRTEAILGKGESPVPWLVRSARLLESAGASLLAMPCVTAHAFIEDIRRAVSARVLSIIQETNGYIMRNHPRVDCVGLLATDGTLKADVFAPLRSRYTLLLPSPNQQRDIMSAVYGPSGIKTVGVNDAAASVLKEAAMSLVARGAQVVIAGCTEIPLALRAGAGSVPTLDTLEILAEAIVREARKQNDEAYGSRKPLSAM